MPDGVAIQESRSSERMVWLDAVASWLKGRERVILLAAICLQLLVLGGMIAFHSMPLLFGKTIMLRVVPVDPRELFRGDYVILSYEFSRTPVKKIEGLQGVKNKEVRGNTVYVTLTPDPDGKHWRANGLSIHRPDEGTFIRGHIVGRGRLQFGIEAYYLQEGKGKEYERAIRRRKLSAEVAVTSSGRAALRALHTE
jgi:uncharacterized membrane-anchored protein